MTNGNEKDIIHRTPNGRFVAEAFGSLGVGEIVSGVTSLGVIAVLDKVAPILTGRATKSLAKIVVEPYLDTIEGTLGKVCHLEECKSDKTLPREQRAEQLARALVLFTPAFLVSWGAKIITREAMKGPLKLPRHNKKPQGLEWLNPFKWQSKSDWIVTGLDESVHLGSMWVLNNRGAGVSNDLLKTTENFLKRHGVSERKAKDIATTLVVWELPNGLGWLSGALGVFGKHHDWWEKNSR